MRVIVCGTRTFDDWELLRDTLDRLTAKLTEVLVVVGDAKGADKLAFEWAMLRKHTCRRHYADWDKHGKKAGMIRNAEMIEDAGPKAAVIAFWDGKSKGTKDTIDRARKAGLKVRVVRC